MPDRLAAATQRVEGLAAATQRVEGQRLGEQPAQPTQIPCVRTQIRLKLLRITEPGDQVAPGLRAGSVKSRRSAKPTPKALLTGPARPGQ